MPVFITTLLSMFTGAFGPVSDWIKRKQELQMLKEESEKQIIIQQMKLGAISAEAEGRAAQTRINATGRAFKYFTFFMWFGPFIIGIVSPPISEQIFKNLSLMPAWYSQSCTLLMFAIWGISVSAPVVTSIFTSLGSFLQAGRDHKENLARINRKVVYDSLRQDLGGEISQKTVDMVDKALDKGEAEA